MGSDIDKFDKYNNYIVAEININANEINKDITIINSFENSKKKYHPKDIDMKEDYKYENEKEIKEKCKIKINNK